MSEKPLENQPNPETQPASNQSAEFLESMHNEAVREQNRRFYSKQADTTLAEKTAEIAGQKEAVPEASIDAAPGADPEVERLIEKLRSAPTQKEGINILMSGTRAGEIDPSDATEALGRMSQEQ